MNILKYIRITLLLILSFLAIEINAQCSLSCVLTNISLAEDESLTIEPTTLIQFNPDCMNLRVSFNNGPFLATIEIPAGTVGTFPFEVADIDAVGNVIQSCESELIIQSGGGNECFLQCNAITTFEVPAGESIVIYPEQILTEIPECDHFGISLDNGGPYLDSLVWPADTYGAFPINVAGTNPNGIAVGVCWGQIFVTNPAACTNDVTPPLALCDAFVTVNLFAGEEYDLSAGFVNDGSYDDCSGPNEVNYFITTDENLTVIPTTETISIQSGTNDIITAYMWVEDEAGNASSCAVDILVVTRQQIVGNVFLDEIQDCTFDSDVENSIGGYTLQYSLDQGANFFQLPVNTNGAYSFALEGQPGMEIILEVLLPNGQASNCPTSVNMTLPFTGLIVQDFSVDLAEDCDNMVVDITTNRLRPCFNSIYVVNYCNHSTYDIEDVELIVNFPDDIVIIDAEIPYIDLGNNQVLFNLGTVASQDCQQFEIYVNLDCNTPMGATRCIEATISPNDCQEGLSNWDGATLRVTGACDEIESLVRFNIENIGAGDMINSVNYIVVEDVVMLMTEPIQLTAGQMESIELPANGSTWRVEIPQEAGHPNLSIPSAAVEGCLEYGSMGFITQFSTPDVEPFVAIDCQEVIASYDPNDKQAYPTGYAEEQFIESNTSIEYKIRFQNTGTDTAYYVRIEDRISAHLDVSSIEPGASSHPYRFELKADGTINFHFENILLVDSTTNVDASQGFVQFRIHQNLDNPIGTVIENTAAIYFDTNDPILTNTVFHTIGSNFISTETVQTFIPNLKIGIAPNPFTHFTNLTLEGIESTSGAFEVYDLMGRLVHSDNFSDNHYQLDRADLTSGTYIFRFLNGSELLANGKLIIQ